MANFFGITHDLNLSPESQEFLAGILDSVDGLVERMSQSALSASSMVSGGLDGIGQFSSVLMLGVLLIALSLCGDSVPNGVRLAGVALVAFRYLVPNSVHQEVLSYAKTLVRNITNRCVGTRLEQQMAVEPDVISAGIKMIYTLIHGFTVMSAPDERRLGLFMKKIEDMPKYTKGIQETVNVVLNVIQNCIESINETFSCNFKFMSSGFEEVDQYVDSVKAFDLDNVNFGASEELHRLLQVGKLLLTKYYSMPEVYAQVNVAHGEMMKAQFLFSQANLSGDAMRPVPWTCMFSGESGVGKSTATYMFLHQMLDVVLTKEKHDEYLKYKNTFIHNRCCETGYWDNYTGQFCCVFDDFGQMIDQPGCGDNEYLNIIRASNNFPYPLHMAALAAKGNTHFSSSVVMCTTNLRTIEAKSIVCDEAVARRFHTWAYVCPKVEFCVPGTENGRISDRRLDKTKLTRSFMSEIYEFHIADVKQKTGGSGNPYETTEVLDWDQMLHRAAVQFASLKKEFKEYNAILCDDERESLRKRDDPKFADLRSQMDEFAAQEQAVCDILEDYETLSHGPQGLEAYEKSGLYNEALVELDDRGYSLITPSFILRAVPKAFWSCKSVQETHGILLKIIKSKKAMDAIKEVTIDLPRDGPIEEHFTSYQKVKDALVQCKSSVFEFFASRPLLKNIGIIGVLISGCAAAASLFGIFSGNKSIDTEDPLEVTAANTFVKTVLTVDQEKDNDFGVFESEDSCNARRKGKRVEAVRFYHEDSSTARRTGKKKEAVRFHTEDSSTARRKMGKIQGAVRFHPELKTVAEETSKPSAYVPPHKRYAVKPPTMAQRTIPAKGLEYNEQFVHLNGVDLEAQAGKDSTGAALSVKITRSNQYSLEYKKKHLGFVLFIKNKTFIMPTHYCRFFKTQISSGLMDDDEMVQFRSHHKGVCYDVPVKSLLTGLQVREMSENDISAFNAPASCMLHPDITKFFYSVNDVPSKAGFAGALDVPMRDCFGLQSYITTVDPQTELLVDEGSDGEYLVRTCYSYKAQTERGDCGSLLRAIGHKGHVRLLGIHTAGNARNAVGVASSVSAEMLQKVVERLDATGTTSQMENLWHPVIAEPIADESMQLTPLYWSEYVPPKASKSKIVASPLNGDWGETKYMPAHLAPFEVDGEVIEPYQKCLEVYSGGVVEADDAIIAACRDDYYRVFAKATSGRSRGLYSFEDAVKGQENVQFCDGIPRGTSPGYPYNSLGVHQGKKKFFGSDGDYEFDSEWCKTLKSDVEVILNKARKGIRSEHVFYDFLKDERRKIPKAMAGKTRMVSGCPLALTVATRMLFMDFTMAVMESRIDNGIAIGMNVYSSDWDYLGKKLRKFGSNVFAGDFSGFDGSETPQFHLAMVEIVNRWYNDSEENQLARTTLWLDMLNSKHITPSGQIYQQTHSLPSGHPLTTIINSLYNHIAFRYCWVLAHGGRIESVFEFTDYVYLIAYGDDNVLNVHPDKADIFNQRVCIEKMAEIGLTYTSEKKEVTHLVPAFRKLDEVSFLKREFVYDDELKRYIAPLELGVITEMPYWTKVNDESDFIVRDNLEAAVRELALHEEEVWDKWFPIFENAGRKVGYCPTTYDQQLQRGMTLSDVIEY